MGTKIVVGGIPVDVLTGDAWAALMLEDWRRKAEYGAPTKVVTTVNGQVVSLCARDDAFRAAVLSADHIAADGMSIVFASRVLSRPSLPERVATTDWFHDAARVAMRHGIRFYFLGATDEANARAVARVRDLYPDLEIAGARNGYFDRRDVPTVAKAIADTRPDVLWIGTGNPGQTIMAHEFKRLIPSLAWVKTCGGLFDFLSGDRSRAPRAMQSAGFEWAYRLLLEPRRLAWRYATTNTHALYLILTKSGRFARELSVI